MQFIQITDAKELISKLKSLEGEGYIFRGVVNSSYDLKPSAFRTHNLVTAAKKYPVALKDLQNWFYSEQIKKTLQLHNVASRDQSVINNFLNLYLHIMRNNYYLFLFVKDNPYVISDEEKRALRFDFPDFWIIEETFIWLIQNELPRLFNIWNLNNTLLQKAHPNETISSINEFLPQHYDIPTTILDWTYDPLIAIYFALDIKEEVDENKGLYTAKNLPSLNFSIYAYKQTSRDDTSVLLEQNPKLEKNLRAQRQKGTFIYFTDPCSFYLKYGKFPSIEDFEIGVVNNYRLCSFDLIKITVPLKPNYLFLTNELEKKGINKSYLFPLLENK